MSDQPRTTPDNKDRRFTLGRVGGAFALLLILLAVFSLTVIETGQVGVVIRSGSDQARVIATPGVYGRLPFVERVWLIDTRLQVSEQTTPQSYTSADRQALQLAGWVAWRVTDPIRFNTATSAGKNPVNERVIKALVDALTAWASTQQSAVLRTGSNDVTAPPWLASLNERLVELGLQAERAGLRQLGLSEAANDAIYARMSAAKTRNTRQLVDGLTADERQLIALQTSQQGRVLDEAYRRAQQIRLDAESQLLAAYARQYGSSREFAETLRNPPSPAGKSDQ